MRFRFKTALIEGSSIEMMESQHKAGNYSLLLTTYIKEYSGVQVRRRMMEYELPADKCMELLDKIDRFYYQFPDRTFDFRKYETLKDYTGELV